MGRQGSGRRERARPTGLDHMDRTVPLLRAQRDSPAAVEHPVRSDHHPRAGARSGTLHHADHRMPDQRGVQRGAATLRRRRLRHVDHHHHFADADRERPDQRLPARHPADHRVQLRCPAYGARPPGGPHGLRHADRLRHGAGVGTRHIPRLFRLMVHLGNRLSSTS